MATKYISIIFIFLFFMSCAEEITKYYPSGEIKAIYNLDNGLIEGEYKTYFKNGNIKSIDLYQKGIKSDSTIFFDNLRPNEIIKINYWNSNSDYNFYSKNYRNENILSEGGYMQDTIKIGKWKYYEDGFLDKVLQYKLINNQQYLNQGWYFNIEGDTIHKEGNNYKFNYWIEEDNEMAINITIEYNPIISVNSSVIFLYSKEFNKDFSNVNKVVSDTIYFEDNKADFKFVPQNLESFRLRGVLKEYADIIPKRNDSITYKERFVYLDEEIEL